MRFLNKRVFITGASRGIGEAIAKAYRAEGAYVIGTQTKKSNLNNDVCDEWYIADFSDEAQILGCADYLRSQAIDILINNAGFNTNKAFSSIDLAIFSIGSSIPKSFKTLSAAFLIILALG